MGTRKAPPTDAQLELFSAVFTDISTRDAQDTMEVPFLSLSKRPRLKPIIYKSDTTEITVTGSTQYGIATIWDWDLVMYLLSQVREAIDRGEQASRKIRFRPHAFLQSARRIPGGVQYQRLDEAIKRLKSTTIETTVRAKKGRTVLFSWLEYGELERDEKGRIQYATVVIPEWLFDAVSDNRFVLSVHTDYFLLTGGIERWLYRFIRKRAGNNEHGWHWNFRTLFEHSGSTQRFSDFVIALRSIAEKKVLLDYSLKAFEKNGKEFLHAKRVLKSSRAKVPEIIHRLPTPQFLRLKTVTYEKAKLLAPGYDIYALEADWKAKTKENKIEIRDPDAAFLGWCKQVGRKNVVGV